MPTYGYECKSCGHNFDAFQSIKDEPLKTCPECGKELRRLINGGTGVIFKGGGFYATDKGGKAVRTAKAEEAATGGNAIGESAKGESAPCPGCAKSESCPKAVNS
jgi:putative FmdB family regulatory protein